MANSQRLNVKKEEPASTMKSSKHSFKIGDA